MLDEDTSSSAENNDTSSAELVGDWIPLEPHDRVLRIRSNQKEYCVVLLPPRRGESMITGNIVVDGMKREHPIERLDEEEIKQAVEEWKSQTGKEFQKK